MDADDDADTDAHTYVDADHHEHADANADAHEDTDADANADEDEHVSRHAHVHADEHADAHEYPTPTPPNTSTPTATPTSTRIQDGLLIAATPVTGTACGPELPYVKIGHKTVDVEIAGTCTATIYCRTIPTDGALHSKGQLTASGTLEFDTWCYSYQLCTTSCNSGSAVGWVRVDTGQQAEQ